MLTTPEAAAVNHYARLFSRLCVSSCRYADAEGKSHLRISTCASKSKNQLGK